MKNKYWKYKYRTDEWESFNLLTYAIQIFESIIPKFKMFQILIKPKKPYITKEILNLVQSF